MFPTQNTQIVTQYLGKLTGWYATKPNIVGLTSAILASVQDLENVAWQVLNGVNLDPVTPPTGQNLDNLAAIVDLLREGRTDPQLWTAFKLQVQALCSRGRTEDILKLANAMTPSTILEFAIMSMILQSWTATATGLDLQTFTELLAEAKDGGARLIWYYTTWADGNDFAMDSAYDSTQGEGGWGSVWDTGTAGGLLVAAQEIKQ